MRKGGWVIFASVLVILGLTLAVAAVAMPSFEFDSFITNSDYTVKNTDFDSSDVKSIKLATVYTDIKIVEGVGDKIIVDYYESDTEYFDIEVSDDGTLNINYVDDRKWYQRIGIFIFDRAPALTVTVPEGLSVEYDIISVSGDISAEALFGDGNISIVSTSGNITVSSAGADEIFIKTTSGDISVNNIDSKVSSIESTSGDISVNHISTDELSVKTTSGEISLDKADVRGLCTLKSTSGELEMGTVSVGTIDAKTVSGNISAEKLTLTGGEFKSTSGDVDILLAKDDRGYSVVSKTTSGSVRLPDRNDGEFRINVKTVSGNINFEIK